MSTPGHSSPSTQGIFITFKNESGETIPSFAVMEVIPGQSVTQESPVRVRKPTGDNLRNILVNDSSPIENGKEGQANIAFNVVVRRNTSDPVPDAGTFLGSRNGSWAACPNASGFLVTTRISSSLPFTNAQRMYDANTRVSSGPSGPGGLNSVRWRGVTFIDDECVLVEWTLTGENLTLGVNMNLPPDAEGP